MKTFSTDPNNVELEKALYGKVNFEDAHETLTEILNPYLLEPSVENSSFKIRNWTIQTFYFGSILKLKLTEEIQGTISVSLA